MMCWIEGLLLIKLLVVLKDGKNDVMEEERPAA